MEEYQWQNYVEIDPAMDPDKIHMIRSSLNWLEDYYPGFQEILWDLKIRRDRGLLEDNAVIQEGTFTQYDLVTDTFDIQFAPYFYLGRDGRFYEFSLPELIVHEWGGHGTQNIRGDFLTSLNTDHQQLATRLQGSYDELEVYLVSNGVEGDYGDYIFFYDLPIYSDEVYQNENRTILRSDIIEDPEYQTLLQTHINNQAARTEFVLDRLENGPVDRADSLRVFLGKPRRAHYQDQSIFYDQMRAIRSRFETLHTFSLPPDELRLEGFRSWDAPNNYPIQPIHGGLFSDHLHDSRQGSSLTTPTPRLVEQWQNTYNADTLNVSDEEWRFIHLVQERYFADREISDLTVNDRQIYDDLMTDIKANFNIGEGNDALSGATLERLRNFGILMEQNIPFSRSGWRFD